MNKSKLSAILQELEDLLISYEEDGYIISGQLIKSLDYIDQARKIINE